MLTRRILTMVLSFMAAITFAAGAAGNASAATR